MNVNMPMLWRRLPGETIHEYAGRVNRMYAALDRPPQFQHYWRCAHYPSAIDNFFEQRTRCCPTLSGTTP